MPDTYEPSFFIANAQMTLINAHIDLSIGTRGMNFGLNLYPYFVYTSSEFASFVRLR